MTGESRDRGGRYWGPGRETPLLIAGPVFSAHFRKARLGQSVERDRGIGRRGRNLGPFFL